MVTLAGGTPGPVPEERPRFRLHNVAAPAKAGLIIVSCSAFILRRMRYHRAMAWCFLRHFDQAIWNAILASLISAFTMLFSRRISLSESLMQPIPSGTDWSAEYGTAESPRGI